MPELPVAYEDEAQHRRATHEGMWVFLATEALLFSGVFAVYVSLRLSWPDAFAEASHHAHVWLGTANTALLLLSSFAVAVAVAEHRDGRSPMRWLIVTALLGAAFLVVKGYEYRLEYAEGLVPFLDFDRQRFGPGIEVFYGWYFVATGLHALHLTIGVAVVFWLAWQYRYRGRLAETRLEAGGLYWHLVDVIWLFLYPLIYLVERHAA